MNHELLRRLGLDDKRKLSLIAALLVIGLLLWGRLLLKQVPRTAVASPPAAAASPSAPAASEQPGAGPEASDAAAGRPTVYVDVPAAPARDLFEFNPGRYARVTPPEAPVAPPEPVGAPVAVEKPDPEGKSESDRADEMRRVAAARRAATGLVLHSTILGERPRAVIDGQTVAPGQTIKGFELRRVMPRRVVLEMNGIEVYLDM